MIGDRVLLAAIAFLTLVTPCVLAQDPADEAWNRGDHDAAKVLYAERLEADSTDVRALHRMALLFAWNREFDSSVALFDRLLTVAPENVDAHVDRARVLSWAGRYGESAAGYTAVLTRRPGDRRARVGLAQTLSWAGHLDSAASVYRSVVADDPRDLEALQGLARVTAWSGDLLSAETRWNDALEIGGADGATLIGLSQTLRWQGRAAAARAALDRVPVERRNEADFVEEQRWVDVALSPNVAPSVTYEWDSDHNEMVTVALRGGHPLTNRARVELAGHFRSSWDAAPGTLESWGMTIGGQYVFEPGWTIGAGAGLSSSSLTDSWTEPSIYASASSPRRHRLGVTVSFHRSAFDATRDLVEAGVTLTEGTVTVRARIKNHWQVDGGLAYGVFDGTEPNRRLLGRITGTRRITPAWAAVARARVFGFELGRDVLATVDPASGAPLNPYFNPDFYFQGELFPRWQPLRGPWHLTVEVAPGIERLVLSFPDPAPGVADLRLTARASTRGAYDIGPGRQISLSAMYTNIGVVSTGGAGYRYLAITLAGSWAF
jgi:Flp pilus assembly protein TadD